MMNTEHAPTPWTVLPYQYWLNEPQRGRIHGPNNEPVVDDVNPTFADAALIVQAVNERADLLAALEDALDTIDACGSIDMGQARTILKQAKEEA